MSAWLCPSQLEDIGPNLTRARTPPAVHPSTAVRALCPSQDFEALTPNLLARTVETVEGGGIVVLLLSK